MARTSRIWITGSAAAGQRELRTTWTTATPSSQRGTDPQSAGQRLRLDPYEHWSLDRVALPEYSNDSPTMGTPA
ncbi:hypothetical protein FJZ36_10045 [Candidatus Poribacteria bacterium]|nr:hypothetical protein [Candidatus Poribacteria bacterium]